jgi:hypothetical protein
VGNSLRELPIFIRLEPKLSAKPQARATDWKLAERVSHSDTHRRTNACGSRFDNSRLARRDSFHLVTFCERSAARLP